MWGGDPCGRPPWGNDSLSPPITSPLLPLLYIGMEGAGITHSASGGLDKGAVRTNEKGFVSVLTFL
jgi:hypothetical protein